MKVELSTDPSSGKSLSLDLLHMSVAEIRAEIAKREIPKPVIDSMVRRLNKALGDPGSDRLQPSPDSALSLSASLLTTKGGPSSDLVDILNSFLAASKKTSRKMSEELRPTYTKVTDAWISRIRNCKRGTRKDIPAIIGVLDHLKEEFKERQTSEPGMRTTISRIEIVIQRLKDGNSNAQANKASTERREPPLLLAPNFLMSNSVTNYVPRSIDELLAARVAVGDSVISIVGPEGQGKSSLLASATKTLAKLGHRCVYFDVEKCMIGHEYDFSEYDFFTHLNRLSADELGLIGQFEGTTSLHWSMKPFLNRQGPPIVLAVDHLELLKPEMLKNLLGALRRNMDQMAFCKRQAKFLLCCSTVSGENPLVDLDPDPLRAEPFSDQETRACIEKNCPGIPQTLMSEFARKMHGHCAGHVRSTHVYSWKARSDKTVSEWKNASDIDRWLRVNRVG